MAVGWWVSERYDAVGTRELALVLVAVGLWAANSFARVLVSDPTITHVLLSTEVFFGVTASVLWFRFATRYTDCRLCNSSLVRYGLFGLATAALLVPLTHPLHGQMWTAVTPVERQGVLTYEIGRGVAHYLLTVSGYLVVLIGSYFLVALLWSNVHARPALLALLSGFALLVGANALPYVADGMLIRHSTTITPLGATFFAVGTVIAVQYNLFTVVPVARDRIVAAMLDPLVVLDLDGRVVEANDPFRAVFGAAASRTQFDDGYPTLASKIDVEAVGAQSVAVDADGGDAHYSVTVSAVESGMHTLGYALLFREVTQLVEARDELERQNAQLDEFASTAAHNLRNPLGIVSGYTGLLETHLDAAESAAHEYDPSLVDTCLSTIDEHTGRMDEILTDLLRVTREGKTLTSVEPVRFGRAIRFALDAVEGERRLRLSIQRDGTIRADPRRLETLLFSILRSALDRGDTATATTVRARLTDEGFVIEDTAGIVPSEDAEMLLSYGYSTKYSGTGLGLSVARTVANAHRWTIRIDSEYVQGIRIVVEGAETTLDALEQS